MKERGGDRVERWRRHVTVGPSSSLDVADDDMMMTSGVGRQG
jgi:hypothetical protein